MKAKWKHFGVKVLKVFEGDFFKENHAQITISSKITYLNFFDSMRKRGKGFKYNSLYPRFSFLFFFPGMKDLLLVQQCQHFLSLVGIYSSKLALSHQIPRFTFVRSNPL